MSHTSTRRVQVHLPVPVDDYLARLAEESGEVCWMTFAEPVGRRAMRAVFNANGPTRMGLGVGMLKPIEAEMRRRGLEADYWSMEHWRRSNAAFRSELN